MASNDRWISLVGRRSEQIRNEAALIRERAQAISRRLADGHHSIYNPRLSQRERQVLRLLSTGLPTKTIALRLGISTNTANYHMANIYRKLGVHGRVAAANVFQQMIRGALSG